MSRSVRKDIQGLRALAVLGVAVDHAVPSWLPGGYVGVDVFFVISGFLITGQIARRVRDPERRFSFADFYAARVRRLLPMSALVLVCTLVAARLIMPPLKLHDVSHDALATASYWLNIKLAVDGTNYLANPDPSVFQHYWSLGVEEQFYLVWPLLILAAAWIAPRSRQAAAVIVALITATSLALCVHITHTTQPWAFFSLYTRAWEFAAGGAVALGAAWIARTPRAALTVAGWAGLVAVVWSMTEFGTATTFPGWAAVIPVFGTALVIASGARPMQASAGRILSISPAMYVGDRSYSLYLWHWPLLAIPAARWHLSIPTSLALLAAAMLLSIASYRFVEQPVRLAPRLRSGRRALGLALSLTSAAVIAGLLVPLKAPLASSYIAPPLTATSLAKLTMPYAVPRNLTPSLQDSSKDVAVLYHDGCHAMYAQTTATRCVFGTGTSGPRIALLGDSHAAQWFPALQRIATSEHGMLLVATKSSCPAFSAPIYSPPLKRDYTECARWRASAEHLIDAFRPSSIVLTSYTASYASLPRTYSGSFAASWLRGAVATRRALPASATLIVLGDTPSWPADMPNACLSAHLGHVASCTQPTRALVETRYQRLDARAAKAIGARFVATANLLCDTTCPPIIANTLVYRDQDHLTATISRALATELARHLNGSA